MDKEHFKIKFLSKLFLIWSFWYKHLHGENIPKITNYMCPGLPNCVRRLTGNGGNSVYIKRWFAYLIRIQATNADKRKTNGCFATILVCFNCSFQRLIDYLSNISLCNEQCLIINHCYSKTVVCIFVVCCDWCLMTWKQRFSERIVETLQTSVLFFDLLILSIYNLFIIYLRARQQVFLRTVASFDCSQRCPTAHRSFGPRPLLRFWASKACGLYRTGSSGIPVSRRLSIHGQEI